MDRLAWRAHRLVVAGKIVLRCAITDLSGPGASLQLEQPADRAAQLRAQVRRWAVDGVDIVQLREKQLESGELFALACMALAEIRASETSRGHTRLVVNGRADVAAAAGADGVHLTGQPGELLATQARALFLAAGHRQCLVSASCHEPEEAARAHSAEADVILFGPVFEKRVNGRRVLAGRGLEDLRRACTLAGSTPVLALGGVTADTLPSCLEAGAAGVAGIRLFVQAVP